MFLFNIIKGVLGAGAYPLIPAFLVRNRAVLTLTRRVLTPGLPHAYPLPEGRLPRHGPLQLGPLALAFPLFPPCVSCASSARIPTRQMVLAVLLCLVYVNYLMG